MGETSSNSLNLHQLRIFYAVTECMSFSAAGRDLFMTQPAISLQVRALEKNLRVKLFDRSGNKLGLTPAGEMLLQSTPAMLQAEDEARQAIDELRGVSQGRLVIGSNVTGGLYLLTRILRAFLAENAGVEIILQVEETEHICERVNQNMIDLALVGGPVRDGRLTVEPLVEDEVVLIVSPDNPLAKREHITLQELSKQRLIVAGATARVRLLVERSLREAGYNLRPAMQLTGAESVKRAVEANLGVAFASFHAVERELALGYLRRVDVRDLHIVRPLVLVHRAKKHFTPAARQFHQFVRSYLATTAAPVPVSGDRE
ncbi:MAG: LysR substrate-binding domain-containing protein [Chloroflexota bacterium]